MLKNILNLEGAQELNIDEQKDISGGAVGEIIVCCPDDDVIISYPAFLCSYIECQR